jgi:2-polyprenyl-3-methyl-5-hydroxy-6-metoxy-1,4-benzoquinol methylase
MIDRLYSHPALVALYDTFGAGRRDFGFYVPLVMLAQSVLDVGCGTGALLHAAREAGHAGRLCGLDTPTECCNTLGKGRMSIGFSVTSTKSHGTGSPIWC